MRPSTGVTDPISTTPENASEPATPTPTPTSEEMSGMTAGRNAPSMTTSTTAAMSTPAISPGPMMPSVELAISVE